MEKKEIKCPVCEGTSEKVRADMSSSIKQSLGKHYNDSIGAEELEVEDYELRSCCVCSLEFAWPMKPGSESFYEWVCKQPNYYPKFRWEYKEVAELIGNTKLKRPFRVLDVGCGSGRFLKYLKESLGDAVDCVGVDLTPGAISQADQEQIRFVLGDHRLLGEDILGKFDIVTSFHCLEHVDNPVSFIEGMIKHATEHAPVVVSTPLSPMSFEYEWCAIMNLPPHHMTRWNVKSYDHLGRRLKRRVNFKSERPSWPLGRTSNSVNRSIWGMHMPGSSIQRYFTLLKHPLKSLRHFRYQLGRTRLNGLPCGEDIYVVFTKP